MSKLNKIDQAYADLGLTPTATMAEVKASYRKLSLKFHPDRNEGSKTAHDDFIRVSNAVQVNTSLCCLVFVFCVHDRSIF